MSPTEYRELIKHYGLSQRAASKAIGVDERTSRKYALKGVPEKHSPWVQQRLEQFKTNNATPEGERE